MTTKNKPKASPAVAKDLLSGFLETLQQGFETDTNLETSAGVEFDYGRYGTFILRRAIHRNAAYSKAFKEKILPHIQSRVGSEDDNDDEVVEQKMSAIYAETVIIGLKTADGQTIPYDAEAKKAIAKLFISAPDLFAKIKADASDAANFRKKKTEAEAKN